jgi:hypothetical protein
VRRCVVMMQQSVLCRQKFGTKFSHIFTQSLQNVTVLYGIDCLACQAEFSVYNPLHVKRKWWVCSRLFSSPVTILLVSVSLNFPYIVHALFPEHLFNHCQSLHCMFSEICTTFKHIRCQIRQEIASGQAHGSK